MGSVLELLVGATFVKVGVLPKLSSHTLHALLTSNDLWISCEEKR
ncbi:hypothetical protein A2U01_0049283, partial [Trifolium medium]|nr:hypothetical protein [Trifolium medium]